MFGQSLYLPVALLFSLIVFAPARALPDSPPSTDSLVTIYASHKAYVSIGSGFIVTSGGRIVTAYHVVQGADSVIVVTKAGTYPDVSVVAYDPDRDLITLQINAPALTKFTAIPVGEVPKHLGARTGFALGNPDLKSSFVVHVTFPRDDLLPANQWSIMSGSSHGARFLFSSNNLNLIPIDGTVNRGMSGGPLVVDGVAVGVLSGSEEVSGAGLAWAIPITYAASPNMVHEATQFSMLPPLRLLGPDSGDLKPLRVAETSTSRDLFTKYIAVERAFARMFDTQEQFIKIRDEANACAEMIRRMTDIDHPDESFEPSCGAPFTAQVSAAVESFSDRMNALPGPIHEYSSWITNAVESWFPNAEEVRFGYFRKLFAVGNLADDFGTSMQPIKVLSAELGTRFPERHIDDPRSSAIANYERVTGIATQIIAIQDVLRAADLKFQRLHAVANEWIEFSPKDSSLKALTLAELNDSERAYFTGMFLGYYFTTKYTASYCRDQRAVSPDVAKRIFAWNQEMLPVSERAEQIAADVGTGEVVKNLAAIQPAIEKMIIRFGTQDYCSGLSDNYILDVKKRIPTAYAMLTGEETNPGTRNFLDRLGEFVGVRVSQKMNAMNAQDFGPGGSNLVSSMKDTMPKIVVAFMGQAINSLLALEVDECSDTYPVERATLKRNLEGWQLAHADRLRESRIALTDFVGAGESGSSSGNLDFQLSRFMVYVGKDLKEQLGLADDAGSYAEYCKRVVPALLNSRLVDTMLDQFAERVKF